MAPTSLFGVAPDTGQDFSHRRQWLDSLLEYQASVIEVDVGNDHWMSSHIHGILRNRPDIAAKWSDDEVAWRWKMAWPSYENGQWMREPNDREIEELLLRGQREPDYLPKIRANFANISWLMPPQGARRQTGNPRNRTTRSPSGTALSESPARHRSGGHVGVFVSQFVAGQGEDRAAH